MDSSLEALQALLGQKAGLESFSKSIGELDKAMQQALSRGDTKAILNLEKLKKATENLAKAKEDQLAIDEMVQKAAKENTELTADQIKVIKKHEAAVARNEKVITSAVKAKSDAYHKEAAELSKLNEEMKQNWLNNSKLGKTFNFLGGTVAKFTGGITAAGLAMKALSLHAKATELRQEILIQNFRGFRDATTGAAEGIIDVGLKAAEMSTALRNAEAAAHRMGVSVESVGPAMVDFARIAGTDNPKALENLTKGAITVSRTLGISMPEAVDFVRTRMDKFGGTAASALISLENIRKESSSVNNMFGRTVVRGDDIVKTLMDISRQTNVYAIDQRLVSGVLRDNISRLQSTGDSYDLARRKAEAYTKAVTGEAPEWMQVLAGEDMIKDLQSAYSQGTANFEKEFGSALDAAMPGLSKQVQDVLKQMDDGTIKQFEGMRLIQEMTKGTSVGMEAMNKQILRLADHSQGIEIIAKQFGVSRVEAKGMVDQAKDFQKVQAQTDKLMGATPKALMEQLNISKELYDSTLKDLKGNEKKVKIRELLRVQSQAQAAVDDENRKKEQEARTAKVKAKAEETLKILTPQLEEQKTALQAANKNFITAQENLKKAEESKDEDAINLAKKHLSVTEGALKQQRLRTAQTEALKNQAMEQSQQMVDKSNADKDANKTVKDISADHLEAFKGYSVNTGNELKAILTEMSDVKKLLAGAALLGVGSLLSKWFTMAAARRFAGGGGGGLFGKKGGPKEGMIGPPKPGMGTRLSDKVRGAAGKGKGLLKGAAGAIAAAVATSTATMSGQAKADEADSSSKANVDKLEKLRAEAQADTDKRLNDIAPKDEPKKDDVTDKAKEKRNTPDAKPAKSATKGGGSWFSKMVNSSKKLVTGASKSLGGGMIGKVVGFLGGALKKMGGVITAAIFAIPDMIAAAQADSLKEAVAHMAPTIGSAVGGTLGLLGGPAGALIAGAGGGMYGEQLKQKLLEEVAQEKKAAKEKAEAEAQAKKDGKEGTTKPTEEKKKPPGEKSLLETGKSLVSGITKATTDGASKLMETATKSTSENTKSIGDAIKSTNDAPPATGSAIATKLGKASAAGAGAVGAGMVAQSGNLATGTASATTGAAASALGPDGRSQTGNDEESRSTDLQTSNTGLEVASSGSTQSSSESGGMTGTVVGAPQADGSITLKVDGFGQAMTKQMGMMKRSIRQPG